MYMICRGLNGGLDGEKKKAKQKPYLLVDWQCDIQVAYGSLRKAFGRFWLFQEGEAATRFLAHVSDLEDGEEKSLRRFLVSYDVQLRNFISCSLFKQPVL